VLGQLASSPLFPLPDIASLPTYAIALCHISFSLIQDKLTGSASTYGNASSSHLISQVEIETLNPHPLSTTLPEPSDSHTPLL
jgi:hypothetical protein